LIPIIAQPRVLNAAFKPPLNVVEHAPQRMQMEAMLRMKKRDIAELRRAYGGWFS
jgi:hypothetical protein